MKNRPLPLWTRKAACLLLVAVGMWMLLSTGACTLAVNTTAVQCTSEAECQGKGKAFENTTCDPMTKTCVPIPSVFGCTTNQECTNANNGSASICRKSDKRCVQLQTPECPTFLGDKSDVVKDDVVLLGAILPTNDSQLGAMMEKAVDLAQDDFSKLGAGGLPPTAAGAKARPVVFVSCNEFGAGIDGLLRAGNHLVKDLQVPIIVGPVDAQNFVQIAAQVALPNKVMEFLPTSGLSSMASLPNPLAPTPLIWNMALSDSSLAAVVTQFVPAYLEQRAKDYGIVEGCPGACGPTRVMMIAEGNLFGLAQGKLIQDVLMFNGKTAAQNAVDQNYLYANMGDQRDSVANPNPAATAAKVIAAAIAFKPHIIIHVSAIVGVTSIYIPLEAQWPMNVPRPIHVATATSWNAGPLYGFIGNNPSRQQRMFMARGKALTLGPKTLQLRMDWDARFKTAYMDFAMVPAINQFVYQVFDAAYMAILASAGVGSAPMTGTNATNVVSMGRMNPPNAAVNASPDELMMGINTLFSGGGINFEGIGAPYDFDTVKGAPVFNAEMACIDVNMAGVGTTIKSSGYVWDNMTNMGSGAVAGCPCIANGTACVANGACCSNKCDIGTTDTCIP